MPNKLYNKLTKEKIDSYLSGKYSFVLLFGLFIAFIIVFYPVFKDLINTWKGSEDYSHGFLIIPISVYLTYMKKEDLIKLPITPSLIGLGVCVIALLFYLIASYSETVSLGSIAMIFLLYGMVIYLYGVHFFSKLLFPLMFLFFMIPVPAQIYSMLTIPLQLFVSQASSEISMLINIPVFRLGNVIYLPEHTLEVVQACSGLRSIVSLFALSTIFGYMTLKSNFFRTILFFSSIPIAIFINIVRVLSMIFAYYYLNYDLTKDTAHSVFGILLFLIALSVLFLLKRILSNWEK